MEQKTMEQRRNGTGKEWNSAFLINIIFLVSINLLIKPLYLFGIDRSVQNAVHPGDYGLYFALFNFTYLFQIISDFGIQHFNNRNIAQYRQLLDKYFPNILVLKSLLTLLYFFVLTTLAWLWAYPLNYFPLLLLLGVNQALSSLILFLRSNISGLGLYRADSIVSVLDRLLMILFCGTLLIIPSTRLHFRIEWFVATQTITLLTTALTAFSLVRRRLQDRLRLRWRPALLWLTLRQSAPYALAVFLMTVYSRLDGVMIERLLNDGKLEADLYASAYRLLDAGNMIGYLFAGLLFPMFARLIKEAGPTVPLITFSFKLLWAGAVALAVATFFFRQPLMEALYRTGGPYSGQILGLLMVGFPMASSSYIFGTLLGAKGSLKALNQIAIAGVLLNISLNMALIPAYKALGAAAATCCTQFLVFFTQTAVARREFNLTMPFRECGEVLGFTACAILLGFLTMAYLPAPWFLKFLTVAGGSLLLAYLFRLISISYIRELF